MENRGEKENPRPSRCFLWNLKGPQRREKRFEREEKTDRRGKLKHIEETTGRRSLSVWSANANATVYTTMRLLHAYRRAIHWTPMNEHGRTRDGNFIRCNATRQSGCRTKRRRKRGPCTVG